MGVRGRLASGTAWTTLKFCKKAQNNHLLYFGRFLIFFFFGKRISSLLGEEKPNHQTNPSQQCPSLWDQFPDCTAVLTRSTSWSGKQKIFIYVGNRKII